MSAFEAHAVDIPADESAQTGFNNLSRRSTRWDRHVLRQPSTVIVIRSNAGPSGGADAGGAAEDGGVQTPLLIPRCKMVSMKAGTVHANFEITAVQHK